MLQKKRGRQVYVVYMGGIQQHQEYSVSSYHLDMLQKVMQGSFVSQSLVRSYNRSFNAFAANLTNQEQEKLASFEEVVSIFPSQTLQTQTTRSWDFMGFPENVDRKLTAESDIVVGVIDSGVWPESESFNDCGFSPPPKKWKGVCRGGKNFSCNKKLVGARFYGYGSNSARDELGHGTHTASTAAGQMKNTSFYGLGRGTARGGVPSARIAVYKACSPLCMDTDILAAFDDAIADGVDIISISISLGDPVDVKFDSIGIAAFHAMQKGILTVQSAGNNGPKHGGIASIVPWVFTVGASTIDRVFIDKVVLGNGLVIKGAAIDTFKRNRVKLPLVYGKDVSSNCTELNSKKCAEGCLNRTLVRNKIVVCDELADSTEAFQAGAAGIIKKTLSVYPPSVVPFPESRLTRNNFASVLHYINSTKHAGTVPKAYISPTKTIHDRHAPRVAGFSARGPNSIIPNILKPDVTAPGAAILAAYPPNTTPSIFVDKRSVNYSILSGTSMACPHVSGAAAYVKSFHPNWSPSAIKSALMTTAWSLKNRETVDAGFASGAGHIDPVKAKNPGLVYETAIDDYTELLCSLGYNTTILRRITGDNNSTCPKTDKVGSKHNDLNYPSMAAKVETNKSFSVHFLRRVTNVGLAKSVYRAKIIKASDINVVVKPRILRFEALNERRSFVVSVEGKIGGAKTVVAELEWRDGIHRVGSPIVVYDDDAFQKQH
ncbi:subtilase family protein [Perilla frutescens var. hirtella]|uniref:Subtilase family protein n=1 Tax=Perilla frutescens var. hirtella TaxID=608512 RepID=A0AAD4P0Q3_PERFH|nr:subtilase family protein [Perilla frutescens var. hirtella]